MSQAILEAGFPQELIESLAHQLALKYIVNDDRVNYVGKASDPYQPFVVACRHGQLAPTADIEVDDSFLPAVPPKPTRLDQGLQAWIIDQPEPIWLLVGECLDCGRILVAST